MTARGRPERKRSLAGFMSLAMLFALLVPLAQVAKANHQINNQVCNLEITPETDQNNTGQNHTWNAVLMLGDSGNATTTAGVAGQCGDGHAVEVDLEFESGPAVTRVAPQTGASDDGNTPATPDMTCTIPVGQSDCQFTFTTAAPGTIVARGWVDDDTDNATHPGSTPSDGDATEGRNAGLSDCIAPVAAGQTVSPPVVDDNALDCPAPGTPGSRTERDDTDVVSKTMIQAVNNVCLDAEPDSTEAGVTNPDTAQTKLAGSIHTIRARVTDGARVGDPDTGLVQDADGNRYDCSGQPLAGQTVRITVTDDGPDVFIDTVNGVSTGGPTFGGPNTVDAVADANGFVTFTVRTVNPADVGTNLFNLTVPGSPGGPDDNEIVGVTWSALALILDATPNTATNEVNTLHTITARLRNQNNQPLANREVDFQVIAGPHADNDLDSNPVTPLGYIGECITAANGDCSRTYTVTELGTDTIQVWNDANGNDRGPFNPLVSPADDNEAFENVNKTTVAAGGGRAKLRLDSEGCNGDRVPPIDEASYEAAALANVVNSVHKFCAELFNSTDQPLAGAVNMSITDGPGFFTPCFGPGSGITNLGTSIVAEEVGGIYAEGCITSNQIGTTQVRATADGLSANGAKPWQGAAARTIDCEPETQSTPAGTPTTVQCTARDRLNNLVNGEPIFFTEVGPGGIDRAQATTGPDGTAEVGLTSTPAERGVQTVTGSLTQTGGVDECEKPANDPVTPSPAGVCADPVNNTWTDPPAAPQCSDGIDNDGDGRTDLDDPGCSGPDDTTESPNPQCSDGVDNDGDGNIDFPADQGCSSERDNDELPVDEPDFPPTVRSNTNFDSFGHGSPFTGDISADKAKCIKKRKVVVRKVGGGKVGSDRTNKFGNFKVGHRGDSHGKGQFFAKAKKKVFTNKRGQRIICKADRSRTITVG